MASKYEISTIFKMIDNFSGPLKNIAGSSTGFAKQFSADMRKTEMQIQAAGQALKTMAGVAVGAGVALAGKTVADSVQLYVEFEDAITKAGSKFKDLDVTSSDYGETLEQLQKAAREVGAVTKFTAVDAAGALDKLAMSGMTSEQAMGMLMGTTNLAAAVGLDLTSAVDMATDAMGAFNLVSEDQNEIAANMNRIADVVARTTNMANTDMSAWFEAVKSGAPQFTALGGDIETFSAAVGTLANAGIKGGEAGTALRNIMLRLSAPAKAGAEAMDELGISVFDSQGKMLPFIDILRQFETQLDGITDQKKAQLLEDIFGARAIGSFQVLMSAGTDELERFTEELYNAAGAAEVMAQAQMQSFQGLTDQLKSALDDKKLSLGKAFEVGGAKEALQSLTTWVQNFDVTPIANGLSQVMAAIPGIVSGIGDFLSFLWSIKEEIGIIVAAWGAYKVALLAALAIEKVVEFVTAIKKVQAATEGMSVAQAALNVVMEANPVGLIITAVAALGVAIYEVIKHWDVISEKMASFGAWISDWFIGVWESLKTAVVDLGNYIAEGFVSAWQGLVSWLSSVGTYLSDVFVSAWNTLKTFFVDFGTYIAEGFVSAWQGLLSWLSSVGTYLSDVFVSAWEGVCGLFTRVYNWIGEKVPAAFALLWDWLKNCGTGVSEFIDKWEFLMAPIAMVKSVFESIYNSVANIYNAFTGGGIVAGIKSIGVAILDMLLAPVQKLLEILSYIPGLGYLAGMGADAIQDFRTSLQDVSVKPVAEAMPVQPVTSGERTAYSYSESTTTNKVAIDVNLDPRFQGKVNGSAPNTSINVMRSGAW